MTQRSYSRTVDTGGGGFTIAVVFDRGGGGTDDDVAVDFKSSRKKGKGERDMMVRVCYIILLSKSNPIQPINSKLTWRGRCTRRNNWFIIIYYTDLRGSIF